MKHRTADAEPARRATPRALWLGLATLSLLGLTVAPALAVTYNVTLGSTSAALSFGAGSSAQNFTGSGSWLKVFPPGPKFETYIPVASLGTAFTINDIASINYHTLNPVVNPSGVDFFLTFYTNPILGGDGGGFYGRRLTAEPYLTNAYVAPTIGVWNTWASPAGPNQLTFNDSNHSGNFGFYGAPTLADLQAGTINWATWAGNPTSGTATGGAIDYGSQGLRYISFQTGSGWASVTSYLDAIQINLKNGNTYNIDLENVADPVIAAQPAATCITPTYPCVEVPVTIARTSATPVRGFSVNLTISANLALCAPNIVQGTFLNSVPLSTTNFQVLSNGGGNYTVDCAILGLPCGQTALAGTLFKLNLSSTSPSGTGTVTINSVTVRDCANGPIAALPGAPLSVPIDNTPPSPITDLAAVQQTSGNGAGPTTGIIVSWATGDPGTVSLYRAPFGSYPEYDDDGAVSPPSPGAAPGGPWTLVSAAATSPYTDSAAPRGYWYYVAFVTDACANLSTVSNMTGGNLDYLLGDVVPGAGNNKVDGLDISALGFSYGLTGEGPVDAVGYLDVGPTLTGSATARPVPDDRIQFEDLIIFAINYGGTGYQAPQMRAMAAAADRDEVLVDAPDAVSAGESFTARVRVRGAGDIQGLSAQLGWDPAVVEPGIVSTSDWMAGMGGVVFSAAAGNVDAALLGSSGRGLAGEGDVATVSFRSLRAGKPGIALASITARDASNHPVVLGRTAVVTGSAPNTSDLMPVAPNPFRDDATLAFATSHAGPVRLAIFDLTGRLVRTLVNEQRAAGTYRETWNGTDNSGHRLQAGLYYVQLTAPQFSRSRKLLMLR